MVSSKLQYTTPFNTSMGTYTNAACDGAAYTHLYMMYYIICGPRTLPRGGRRTTTILSVFPRTLRYHRFGGAAHVCVCVCNTSNNIYYIIYMYKKKLTGVSEYYYYIVYTYLYYGRRVCGMSKLFVYACVSVFVHLCVYTYT